MKICAAQTRPTKGDVQNNIEIHKRLIDLAVSNEADIVVFPELSLTGYEPKLAKELATCQDDSRLDDFQKLSDAGRITIGVGIPTRNESSVCISMILFQPDRARQTYSKQYLHPDEEAFFISGANLTTLKIKKTNIALAICYELSIPEHSKQAFKNGATIYISAVVKFVGGIDRCQTALESLTDRCTQAEHLFGTARAFCWDS